MPLLRCGSSFGFARSLAFLSAGSRDEGIAFANVFKGYVQAGSPTIQGDWASVPLGVTPGQGTLTVSGFFCPGLTHDQPGCNSSSRSAQWNLFRTADSSNPAFGSPPSSTFEFCAPLVDEPSSRMQIRALDSHAIFRCAGQSFFEGLTERARHVRGVIASSPGLISPLSGDFSMTGISVAGYRPQLNERPIISTNWVGPEYFKTLSTPLVAGALRATMPKTSVNKNNDFSL